MLATVTPIAAAMPTADRPLQPAQADARTDADLVRALLSGDASAFEAIMRRHNRLMFRTARGIVRDDAEAQDVVQEAYLRAFTAIAAWRSDAALSTWLARIAINVALGVLRKKGRWVTLDATPEETSDPQREDAMHDTPSAAAGPEDEALKAQTRRLLEAAIDQLPPLYRSVFMLRAVEELSVEETADALAVSRDVVKTRYLRARAMLRDSLGVQMGEGARHLHAFAGARCDAVVSAVLGELQARGFIRPH